ncbi:MAG: DNA damage-inducible protein D [bacterium]
MKIDEIRELFNKFESVVSYIEGVECWSARELQKLLGYSKWENFENVITKAKIACENAGIEVDDHFPDVRKVIEAGKGAIQDIADIALTRYACYLVAQNGDSRKPEISFAQNYFAVQTRKAEIIAQKLLEYERVVARAKLSNTEKNLSGILYERGIDGKGFAIIRSKGDQSLFNLTTEKLKRKLNIPETRPVADFLPTVGIKAKDLAAEMTGINVQSKDLRGQYPIENEHIDNNKAVRNMLISRGIQPESLQPAEDVKKVERKLAKMNKEILIETKKQVNKRDKDKRN